MARPRDVGDRPLGPVAQQLELLDGGHERDHQLGLWIESALPQIEAGLGHRAHLELVQLGHHDAEPHATHAQHRVLLMEALDLLQQLGFRLAVRRVGLTLGLGHGDVHGQGGQIGQELV